MADPAPVLVAKRYQILSELGRGGMGVVYRVKHCFTGELLALKMLNDDLARRERQSLANQRKKSKAGPHSLEGDKPAGESAWTMRFKREMQISARIASEHVVRITDADVAPEFGGSLFYVMELLQGADLDRLIQDRGPLNREETVWILFQLAASLDKAHSAGIVHRDLKPANCFIHKKPNDELIIKLLDFGLAFLVSDDPEFEQQEKLTKTGATLGTLNYFSPEQAMGQREKIGPPTDIWAVGVLTYELLTGQCYFPGSDHTVAVKIARGQLTPPSQRSSLLTPAFDAWFFKSCDLDPKKRWATLGEQAAALAAALQVPSAPLKNGPAPASLKEWLASRKSDGDVNAVPLSIDALAVTHPGLAAARSLGSRPAADSGVKTGRTALVFGVSGESPGRRPLLFGIIIVFLAMVLALLVRQNLKILMHPAHPPQSLDTPKVPEPLPVPPSPQKTPGVDTETEPDTANPDDVKTTGHAKKRHKSGHGGHHGSDSSEKDSNGKYDPAAP